MIPDPYASALVDDTDGRGVKVRISLYQDGRVVLAQGESSETISGDPRATLAAYRVGWALSREAWNSEPPKRSR